MLSRWFARFAAVPALCGALSCSNEMPVDVTPPDSILILVEVVGTLPQMSALQVRASLNSQSDMTGLSITQNTSRFAVKLPNLPENYGALKIDAFSLDSDQCQLASGQVTETLVMGKTYYELKLTLSQQAQRRCQLLVQATGTGNVTSDPTGIDCGGSGKVCAYDFPFGTKVTLKSAGTTTSYPVWGRNCSTTTQAVATGFMALPGAGSPSCSLTLNKGGTAVPVSFVPRQCSSANVCQYNPLPSIASTLYRTWGAAAKDVWAVGSFGTLLHYDGAAWAQVASGTMATLTELHGSGASDVWAGGTSGTVLHYDGTAWTPATLPVTTYSVSALYSFGASDAWAGTYGVVYRWDGMKWNPVGTGLPMETVYALWGASSSDVWAVTLNGVWRWDGTTWKRDMSAPIMGKPIRYLRGFGANNIWAASSTEVFRFDGTSWTAAPADNGATLGGIQGIGYSAGPDVWFVASTGRLFRHAGTADCTAAGKCWTSTTLTDFAANSFYGLYAPSANEAHLVGNGVGTLLSYDGQSWTRSESIGGVLSSPYLYTGFGIASTSPTPSFITVGPNNLAMHYDGTSFATTNPVAPSNIASIHGLSANDLWAVSTSNGTVLHWTGSRWDVTTTGTTSALYGVFVANSPRYIYVVGTGGYMARSTDGTTWTTLTSGVTSSLYSIHGTSGSTLFVAGSSGTLLRSYNGTSWTNVNNTATYPTSPGATETFYSTYFTGSRAFVVGSNTAAYYFDEFGGRWQRLTVPATVPAYTYLYGVSGFSSTRIFAVGDYGTILQYDGLTSLNQVASGVTSPTLRGLWAPNATDTWFFGGNGLILRQKM
ncbi:MAG: hypothetical protein U1A78_38575 [Polyangia bacterium]